MESSFHGGTLEPHIFGGEKNLYTKAGFSPLETSLRVPPNLPQTASTWAQFVQQGLGAKAPKNPSFAPQKLQNFNIYATFQMIIIT